MEPPELRSLVWEGFALDSVSCGASGWGDGVVSAEDRSHRTRVNAAEGGGGTGIWACRGSCSRSSDWASLLEIPSGSTVLQGVLRRAESGMLPGTERAL